MIVATILGISLLEKFPIKYAFCKWINHFELTKNNSILNMKAD